MTDFLNKIVTLAMIFVLLVLAPLLISYMGTDMVMERKVLNEMNQFIDRVTDKNMITAKDLDDLYIGVNAHGGVFDVEVERYVRIAYTETVGGREVVKTTYYRDNTEIAKLKENPANIARLNVTDVVRVHIEALGMSNSNRMMWSILRVDKGKFKLTLAGTVR